MRPFPFRLDKLIQDTQSMASLLLQPPIDPLPSHSDNVIRERVELDGNRTDEAAALGNGSNMAEAGTSSNQLPAPQPSESNLSLADLLRDYSGEGAVFWSDVAELLQGSFSFASDNH